MTSNKTAGRSRLEVIADRPATDQRSETRPVGAQCDIGAYEAVLNYVYLPLVLR